MIGKKCLLLFVQRLNARYNILIKRKKAEEQERIFRFEISAGVLNMTLGKHFEMTVLLPCLMLIIILKLCLYIHVITSVDTFYCEIDSSYVWLSFNKEAALAFPFIFFILFFYLVIREPTYTKGLEVTRLFCHQHAFERESAASKNWYFLLKVAL